MGAPVGNQFAAKAMRWQQAIERALAKRSSRKDQLDALDDLAEKLLQKCDEGDMIALKELGDRLDGKPKQPIDADLTGKIYFGEIKRVVENPRNTDA